MAFGLLVKDSGGVTTIDSTVRFTRYKGTHSVSIGALGAIAYATPPNYVSGDIIVLLTSTAPFLDVHYELTRIKFTNTEATAGTVTYMLLGFL